MHTLTHHSHLDEIMSAPMSQREKLRLIDEQILDVLYDDQLRTVAFAMSEPMPYREPYRLDKPVAAIWAGALLMNFSAIFFGGFLLWQMIRP